MPHFGLMDEKKLGPAAGPLQRARLHIRGGKRRLRQGKIAAGIVTLYDALEGAMRFYIGEPARLARLDVRNIRDINSDRVLYAALTRAGVVDGTFDFEAFDRLTERALNEEMPEYDYTGLVADIERIMVQLGVMPFDEDALPPEDPNTF